MPRTLAKLQEQIAKLQKEAESIRAKEVAGVVRRIREAIEHYELTVEDLFGNSTSRKAGTSRAATAPAGKRKRVSPVKGRKVPVKYRDEAGNTWTGRGNRPRWLSEALAAGKSLADFAV